MLNSSNTKGHCMNTKKYPETVRNLLEDVISACATNKIILKLTKGKTIKISPRQRVSGYFDECERALAVATNMPLEKWIGIFVHESCHMDQWLEASRYWSDDLAESLNIFDRYLGGSDEKEIKSAIDNVVMMEADCERRAYKKIMRYELPIDLNDYAKRANAYLLSHKSMLYYKSWYKIPPYRYKQVYGRLPDVISAPFTYKMSNNKIDPTFFKKCFD